MAGSKQMDLRHHFNRIACDGNVEDFFLKITTSDGNPDDAETVAAFPGQLCYDYTNNAFYVNRADTTTWVTIGTY